MTTRHRIWKGFSFALLKGLTHEFTFWDTRRSMGIRRCKRILPESYLWDNVSHLSHLGKSSYEITGFYGTHTYH